MSRKTTTWVEADDSDVMVITPDRIVVCIAAGLPATQVFGAMSVYVSRSCPIKLTLEGEAPRMVEFAIVPPHIRHSTFTADGHITKVLIETETIDVAKTMELLSAGGSRRNAIASRMREGFVRLPQILDGEVDVDAFFFGGALPMRTLDPRIARVVAHINRNIGEKLSGQDCAELAGLSFSRFIHLFRAETGSTFRGYQAWRHARNFMPFVNGSYNLIDVAMRLGYADAPHFSRSIRQYYGITPKQISAMSRKLRVIVQPPYRIQGQQRIANRASPKKCVAEPG